MLIQVEKYGQRFTCTCANLCRTFSDYLQFMCIHISIMCIKMHIYIYIYIYIYILIMTQIQYIFYVFVTSKHVTYKEYAQVLLTTSNYTDTGYCLHNVLLEYQSRTLLYVFVVLSVAIHLHSGHKNELFKIIRVHV